MALANRIAALGTRMILCSKERSEMDHHGGHEMATTASNSTESSMMNHHMMMVKSLFFGKNCNQPQDEL